MKSPCSLCKRDDKNKIRGMGEGGKKGEEGRKQGGRGAKEDGRLWITTALFTLSFHLRHVQRTRAVHSLHHTYNLFRLAY